VLRDLLASRDAGQVSARLDIERQPLWPFGLVGRRSRQGTGNLVTGGFAAGLILVGHAYQSSASRAPGRRGDIPARLAGRGLDDTGSAPVIMVEWHGYGRAYPPERRQIVGSVFHLADREPYSRLNDAVCVCTGEVRTPGDPAQAGPDLVMDVAELIWEPIAG
jgi:hypothetical protein